MILQAVNFGFACEPLGGNFGFTCEPLHSNLAETSSVLHPYRMIPLSQESASEKGIGEHEQELQSIYAEEAREELTANYCKETKAIWSDAWDNCFPICHGEGVPGSEWREAVRVFPAMG